MRDTFDTLMSQGVEEFGITLSGQQMNQFYQYYQLLTEWNKVMNLTAITDLKDVVIKHFVDSLALVKVITGEQLECWKVLDLGTGAGFPGIPLKIVFPYMRITLLDSLNKRVKFLQEVISQLELNDINAVHGRAEELGRNLDYREQYDLCVSRAVANLSTLSEYCIPFVKSGGYFIPYKSGKTEDEILTSKGALKLLGGEVEFVEEFLLPGSDMERTLVKIKKTKKTSVKYPRKAGMPGKEPLK